MSCELKDPEFHGRLVLLIGQDKPFSWSDRIGISKGAFSRVWNEGTIPGPVHLKRIAEKTGVSIDWLLTGEGDMKRGKGREGVRQETTVTGGILHQMQAQSSAGDVYLYNSAPDSHPGRPELSTIVPLLERYANQALLEKLTAELLKIKKAMEGE